MRAPARWPALPLALVAMLSVAACTSPPEAPLGVSLRLRAGDFGQPVAEHDPMMAIESTAREVVALPDRVPIAESGALFEDGVAEMEVDLESVPPGSIIELDVILLGTPTLLAPDVRAVVAAGGRPVRLEGGWTLDRLSDGRGRLRVQTSAVRAAVPDEQEPVQVAAELFARAPIPPRLTSRPFSVAGGKTIELSYGLLGTEGATTQAETELRATLSCDGKELPLLAAAVTPGRDQPGWRVHSSDLPDVDGPCTLELTQADAAGAPSAYVVWGAPRVWGSDAGDLRVVVISLDTLRADHMSGYGYPRATTPEIDRRLMDRGVRFEDAMTTVASTGMAHLSLFTGLFPRDQRTSGRLDRRDATVTLAERFQDAKYATAAFTEDGLVAGPFGFWFGFDLFREYHVVSDERGTHVFRDGIDYLRSHRDRRFFLFLHTYKVHDPFEPTEATADLFRDGTDWKDGTLDPRVPTEQRTFVDAYDRTIVEADRMVGEFLDELDRLGLADETLVVLLSDHGEAFGEHRILGHGLGVQQEQLQIPLVFRGPGVAHGEVRKATVGITDVAATILDLAGLEHGDFGSSRSVATLVRAGTDSKDESLPQRPLFFTRLMRKADGARYGSTKVLKAGEACTTWDLASDPREDEPKVVPCQQAALASEIDSYRARAEARLREGPPETEKAPSIPAVTKESLRALGYTE